MNSTSSVVIDRPIDEVFKLTMENVAEWSIIVVEDTFIEDVDHGGVGTRFRTVTNDRGKEMVFEGLVTDHEPPKLCSVEMRGEVFDIFATYEFSEVDGGTKVTQYSSVSGKGMVKVMFLLFGWMMKRASCNAQNNELQSLKRFCENYEGAV